MTASKRMNALAMIFRPSLVVKRILRRLPGLSLRTRLDLDLLPRPYYAYGIYQAAIEAKRLGHERMSAIEFGVAGGTGLVVMERLAELLGRAVGIDIEVYGFDSGGGLPPPADNRDLPYVWKKGFYKIDEAAVAAKLRRAKLVFGLVSQTVGNFVREQNPAAIGFIAFDLDYYTSTVEAFKLFDAAGPEHRLPRVFCYFDDIIGPDEELHCQHVGELAAIVDFNAAHPKMKLGRIFGLRHKRIFHSGWCDQMHVLHDLDHPQYATYLSVEADKQEPLRSPAGRI
jgi:hypothetical protein